MEARTGLVVFVGFLLGCAQNPAPKTEERIFSSATGDCSAQLHPTQYLAEWEDGHYSIEHAASREELLVKFVRPNLKKLKFVEQSQLVALDVQTTSEPTEPREVWGQTAIGALELHGQGLRGAGVTIAVIDTGVDPKHPQISGQLHKNAGELPGDGIDNDGNGYIDDISGWDFATKNGTLSDPNGHGTHVAGIAAGAAGKFPTVGVAPSAKILPLRFMDDKGLGDLSHAVLAIEYAAQQGAQVINASWGGKQCFKSLDNAIKRVQERGILVVVAAGNDGLALDKYPKFPAAFENSNQITVGASTYRGYTAGFSNTGPLVHLVAPGMEILSAYKVIDGQANWAWRDGTSMAAPFVSGAIALLKSAHPFATAAEIKNALLATTRKGYCCTLSEGELDAVAAHKALSKPIPTP